MSRWFPFWRAPRKLLDCNGPYAVSCTDFMCGALKEGSFVRLFYPTGRAEQTEKAVQDSDRCLWLPRKEYAEGLIKFMKLPVWLLGGFLHWCTGRWIDF